MSQHSLAHKSCLLFVPGNRPDRFDKAAAASPDGIVIDLEDAVPQSEKPAALRAACDYLARAREGGMGPSVYVRLNPLGTRAALDDLAALADGRLAASGLCLAKVEAPRDIELVRAHDPAARPLLAAIETARGINAAAAVAAALGRDDALGFGGADLAADLGAAFEWEPLFAARGALVIAAAAVGIGLFDVPQLDLADAAALRAEALRVRAMGFTGKLAIHPAQVAPILDAFQPSEAEITRARRVLAALDAAHGGAAQLDGKMIDLPVANAARRILARAEQRQ
ncbi:MAG: aldolase/citrate lyase family protein [Phaeovulum sp.]|uniref:HpcH/HpaI aldolase/citrate lyase family protein n=1 Tax=Phaeovulum sp. TaxID=2934796 RepID=UPI00272F192F|nr:aldolase/citrate lyase family protein [Phaeovulum sp.]MDP2063054.1 aldolase/citrate lyase family protein [Phaeovulum sp.]